MTHDVARELRVDNAELSAVVARQNETITAHQGAAQRIRSAVTELNAEITKMSKKRGSIAELYRLASVINNLTEGVHP